MLNSHSIPHELWMKARERLIFFFSRRLGIQNAEDLAHNTLLAIWARKDYEFEKEEDFLKVCYGFARKILQEVYRDKKTHYEWVELDPETEEKVLGIKGLKGAEAAAFLEEVRRYGQKMLDAEEWELIETMVNRDQNETRSSGRIRTRVHRIRNRLAKITGWKKL